MEYGDVNPTNSKPEKRTGKPKKNSVKSSRPIDKLLSPYAFQVARCPMTFSNDLFDSIASYLNIEGLLQYSEAFKLVRSCMAVGLKECVRMLEKNKAVSILLIDSGSTCATLLQHLIAACAVRSCPVLLMSNLTQFLVKMNGNGNYICVAFKNVHSLPDSITEQLEIVKSHTVPIENPDNDTQFEQNQEKKSEPKRTEFEDDCSNSVSAQTSQELDEIGTMSLNKSVETNDGQNQRGFENNKKSKINSEKLYVKGYPVVSKKFQANHEAHLERSNLLGAMKTDRVIGEQQRLFHLYSTEKEKQDYLRSQEAQTIVKEARAKKKQQSAEDKKLQLKKKVMKKEQLANKKKMLEQIKKGSSVTVVHNKEIKQPGYMKANFSRTKPG